MIECGTESAKLAAYLDGEATEVQAAAMRSHIATCTWCAAEVAGMVALKRSLVEARGHFVSSAELQELVRKRVASKKPRKIPIWVWPTLATAGLLVISVAWMAFSHRLDALSEAADLHVTMLASANPMDVVSTDRHTVKPWFAGKIPFTFNVPEFAGTDFTLLGGRVAYFDQQPGAQLLLSMKQHKISVLIFKESPDMGHAFPRAKGVKSRSGFEIETWSSSGLRFVVTGDTEPAAIEKLAWMMWQVNP